MRAFFLKPTGSFESAFRLDELFIKEAITGFRYSGFRFGFVSLQVWPTKPIIGGSAASLTTLEFFHRGSYLVIKDRLLGSGPRPPLRGARNVAYRCQVQLSSRSESKRLNPRLDVP